MLEEREVITEMSILEFNDFKCPECDRSLKERPAQKVIHPENEDCWELKIRCVCGALIVVIND